MARGGARDARASVRTARALRRRRRAAVRVPRLSAARRHRRRRRFVESHGDARGHARRFTWRDAADRHRAVADTARSDVADASPDRSRRRDGFPSGLATGATSTSTRWAFCFNGRQLRLVDVDRPYARRFLEFDLRETLNDADRSRLLWAFARPAAFAMRAGTRPALVSEIVAACDAHGVGVREALQGGVREALELLCAELARAARRRGDGRSATVTGVARSIDGRGSSPDTCGDARRCRQLRRSTRRRRRMSCRRDSRCCIACCSCCSPRLARSCRCGIRCIATATRSARSIVRPSIRRRAGCGKALQAISRLAHAGCETDGLTITAFNSQLFSPDGAPLIDRARIDSAIVARILQSLMTTPGAKGRGRERITYADLGVEQLGAVYERVLDYAPQLEAATASRLPRASRHRARARRPRRSPACRRRRVHGAAARADGDAGAAPA